VKKWIIKRNAKTGGILVDDHFRVQLETTGGPQSNAASAPPFATATMNDVFAIGDTAVLSSGALPATAQVANQQALWLAKRLNTSPDPTQWSQSFSFKNLGVMAYIGGAKALFQGGTQDRDGKSRGLKGWLAFLLWRGAYLTMTLSWRNKFMVPVQWAVVKVFGRDVTRF
jgi:NADH dehydrogenase